MPPIAKEVQLNKCAQCDGHCCIRFTLFVNGMLVVNHANKETEEAVGQIQLNMPFLHPIMSPKGKPINWDCDYYSRIPLENGGHCTAYDKRPHFCKTFNCTLEHLSESEKKQIPRLNENLSAKAFQPEPHNEGVEESKLSKESHS
jgi:Fe-S-cluster containining protein